MILNSKHQKMPFTNNYYVLKHLPISIGICLCKINYKMVESLAPPPKKKIDK